MTDRLKGCVVTFDRDIREDDAKSLLSAIEQLRGVLSVSTSVSVASAADHMNRERIRHELLAKLYEALERKP